MILEILTASAVIVVTIMIQAIVIGVAIKALTAFGDWLSRPPYVLKSMISLVGISLWLLFGLSLAVWLWAAVYLQLGLFDSIETAVYFSAVTFTTLGYGDIVVDGRWRLLTGLAAADGLILFSLTTAFLIEALRQINAAHKS